MGCGRRAASWCRRAPSVIVTCFRRLRRIVPLLSTRATTLASALVHGDGVVVAAQVSAKLLVVSVLR